MSQSQRRVAATRKTAGGPESRRAAVWAMGIYRPPSSASSMSYGKCFSIHSDAPSVSPSTYLI